MVAEVVELEAAEEPVEVVVQVELEIVGGVVEVVQSGVAEEPVGAVAGIVGAVAEVGTVGAVAEAGPEFVEHLQVEAGVEVLLQPVRAVELEP